MKTRNAIIAKLVKMGLIDMGPSQLATLTSRWSAM